MGGWADSCARVAMSILWSPHSLPVQLLWRRNACCTLSIRQERCFFFLIFTFTTLCNVCLGTKSFPYKCTFVLFCILCCPDQLVRHPHQSIAVVRLADLVLSRPVWVPHCPGALSGFDIYQKSVFCRTHWMCCVLFSRKVQWSHLASLKNNVSPVSRSHSFSDPSPPKFAHHHLRSQDPCPPSRSEVLSQSSDSKAEVPDPAQKAWSRSDSDEVPPRVRSRKTDGCCFFLFLISLFIF